MAAGDGSLPDDKEISHVIEGAERYRTRARSVATITATGAGALTAGLVLNSSSNFTESTKLLGLAAIILLLMSTVLFVIASVVHSRTIEGEKKRLISFALRPWETLYSAKSKSVKPPLIEQSDAVLDRILKTMDAGMWLAGAAILSLILALVTISLATPTRLAIDLTYNKSIPTIAKCPNLPRSFTATALKTDLDRPTGQLLISIPASECGPGGESVSFYVDRSEVQIIIPGLGDE